MEHPVRKHPRLKEYDYSAEGAYFITFCTKNRQPMLSTIAVGRDALIPPQVVLSDCGKALETHLLRISTVYPRVVLDSYVIMPNHVHLLLQIQPLGGGGMGASRPTVQRMIKAVKGLTTRQIGKAIWQDGCYDHIIRSESDYLRIWNYIDQNPAKWSEDCYYIP